jgi:hypothetical protein
MADQKGFSFSVSRALGAVWVTLVALLTTLFAVYSLSAFQVQVRIQSFSAKGLSYSIWNIDRLKLQQEILERDQQSLEDGLRDHQAKTAKVKNDRAQVQLDLWRQEGELDNILYRLLGRIAQKDASYSKLPEGYGYQVFTTLQSKLETLGLSQVTQQLQADYEALYAKADITQAQVRALDKQLEAMGVEAGKRTEELNSKRKEAGDLVDGDAAVKNQVLDFASEVKVLDQYTFLRALTRIPNEMLVLLLIVAMGLLGSSIYLMRSLFVGGAEVDFQIVLFRQFLGALTALMMFVVVKAGVLVVSDPRSTGQSGALNPFLLAFLGIIAGLISEQVIERISQWGRDWLRDARVGNNRFARGVQAEIDAQKKSIDDLAKFFDDKKELVAAWLTENEPIPAPAQAIIAAWLNKSERDLFSDTPKNRA